MIQKTAIHSSSQEEFTLYGGPSNRAGRVMWLLEELELHYQLQDLELFKGEQRTPEYLRLNPKGKVPTLIIKTEGQEAEVIHESAAILYTVAERYARHDQVSLIPQDPRERAQLHQWMAFGMTELEPPVWIHAKHSFVYPEKRRVSDIFPSCHYDYQRALQYLDNELSDQRSWLCSDHFTIADLFIGHTLMWGELRGLSALGEDDSFVTAYLARLKERPAWKRAFTPSAL